MTRNLIAEGSGDPNALDCVWILRTRWTSPRFPRTALRQLRFENGQLALVCSALSAGRFGHLASEFRDSSLARDSPDPQAHAAPLGLMQHEDPSATPPVPRVDPPQARAPPIFQRAV